MKLLELFGLGNSRDKAQDTTIAALAARVKALEDRPTGGTVDQAARDGVAAVGARVAVIEAEFDALDQLE